MSDSNEEFAPLVIGEELNVVIEIPQDTLNTLYNPSLQWQIKDTQNGTFNDIDGQNSSNIVITTDYAGKFMRLLVLLVDAGGDTHSVTSQVYQVESVGAIFEIVLNDSKRGTNINVTLTQNDPDGIAEDAVFTYQWQYLVNYIYVNSSSTESTYTLDTADSGKTLRCQVTYTDLNGYEHTVNTNSVTINASEQISASLDTAADDAEKTNLIVKYANNVRDDVFSSSQVKNAIQWTSGLLHSVLETNEVQKNSRTNALYKSVAYSMSRTNNANNVVSRNDLLRMRTVSVSDEDFEDGDVILGRTFHNDYNKFKMHTRTLDTNDDALGNLTWGGEGESDPQSQVQTLYTEKNTRKSVVVRITSYDENGVYVSGPKSAWQYWVLHAFSVDINDFTSFVLFDSNDNVILNDTSNYEVFLADPTSTVEYGRFVDHTDGNAANRWLLQKTFTTVAMESVTWNNVVWLDPVNITVSTVTLKASYDTLPDDIVSAKFAYEIVPTAAAFTNTWTDFNEPINVNEGEQTQIVDLTTYFDTFDASNTAYKAQIRVTAEDSNGVQYSEVIDNGSGSLSFTFNRLPDTTKPILQLNGLNVVEIVQNSVVSYTDAGAVATDDFDGDISNAVVVGGDVVNPAVIGEYVITYNVVDASGNHADQIIRTVNVVAPPDTTAPVITLNGDSIIEIIQNSIEFYTDEGASATDNVDNDLTVVVGGQVVDPSTIGTYVITYNVTDASGNEATQVTRTVNVVAPPDNDDDDTGAEGGSGGSGSSGGSAGDPYIRTLL